MGIRRKRWTKRDAQNLCTGFGNTNNYILERTSLNSTFGINRGSAEHTRYRYYTIFSAGHDGFTVSIIYSNQYLPYKFPILIYFIHLFIHSFIHSLIHSFIHSFNFDRHSLPTKMKNKNWRNPFRGTEVPRYRYTATLVLRTNKQNIGQFLKVCHTKMFSGC